MDTVSWDQFKRNFRWEQGDHMSLIGPTKAGKTTLMIQLLPYRKYSIFFGTKRRDPLYDEIIRKHGFRRVENFSDIKPWDNRILLWPKHTPTIAGTVAKQKARFRTALDAIAEQGGWSAWFDECKYMSEMLGLTKELTFCQEQLRSNRGTNISGGQRPVWLPRSVLANTTHLFIWKTTDQDDLKRLSDMGGLNSREIKQEIQTLGKHEFIYVHTRGTESRMVRSQVGI